MRQIRIWFTFVSGQPNQEEAERLIRRINWVGFRVSAKAVGKTVEPYASDSKDEAEEAEDDDDGDAAVV